MTHETPADLVELLDGVVRAAARTAFYAPILDGRSGVGGVEELAGIPVTPLGRYRDRRLADLLAEPSRVGWIVGPYRGQAASSVAAAEGGGQAADRCYIFTGVLNEHGVLRGQRTCAVVSSPERRYFAAEIATFLIRSGVRSHLFVDHGKDRTYERLDRVRPDLLVVLSDGLVEEEFPSSVDLCITFGRSHRIRRFPQLDLYVVGRAGVPCPLRRLRDVCAARGGLLLRDVDLR